MKIIKYSLLVFFIALFTKCSPDSEGDFGDKVDRTAQLLGTWKINNVFQIDLDAEKKSFPDFATKVDITNVLTNMPFTDFEMNITAGSITTTLGMSPMSQVIDEGQGVWDWISNTELALVNQTLGINASEGIKVTIGSNEVTLFVDSFKGITSATPTLSLNYLRKDNSGNNVVRYEYILAKQ